MRPLFHRRSSVSQLARADRLPNGGTGSPLFSRYRSASASSTPGNVTPTAIPQGACRAPPPRYGRARSMSTLYGALHEGDSHRDSFTGSIPMSSGRCRSQSLSSRHPVRTPSRKSISETDEDALFQCYTRKVYFVVALLAATVVGFTLYAFIYNT